MSKDTIKVNMNIYDIPIVVERLKKLEQENKQLKENYERIYNENCILRENHNINDISLLDENEQLNNILNEIENMCKEEYYERNTIDIDSIVFSSHLDAKIYLKIKELRRSINENN